MKLFWGSKRGCIKRKGGGDDSKAQHIPAIDACDSFFSCVMCILDN